MDLEGATLQSMCIDSHKSHVDLVVKPHSGTVYIENKPWAPEHRKRRQLQDHAKAAKEAGATFCVLISCGNPQPDLWDKIRKERYRLILWEEVLQRMDDAGFARELADRGDLKPYYKLYVG